MPSIISLITFRFRIARHFAVFGLALLINLNAAFAAPVWYVSGNGDDSANGTSSATAFRTLQKAGNMVEPGDTVLVGEPANPQRHPNPAKGSALSLGPLASVLPARPHGPTLPSRPPNIPFARRHRFGYYSHMSQTTFFIPAASTTKQQAEVNRPALSTGWRESRNNSYA